MKLILNGNINVYYVQTLCMIFFPGEKFGQQEEQDPDTPVLRLTLLETTEGMEASVDVSVGDKTASSLKVFPEAATLIFFDLCPELMPTATLNVYSF